MPARRVTAPAIEFHSLVAALAAEYQLPADFTDTQLAQAHAAAKAPLPHYPDRTDINLVTIAPAGSHDLDQALCLQRTPSGYRIYYAVADVAHFVEPGSELDKATTARGETVFLPGLRIGLYPSILSEGAASLLPGQTRPAALWTIEVDRSGEAKAPRVERALVRSRAQYDYRDVQQAIVTGHTPAPLEPLAELGALLIARCRSRGAIDMSRPEQRVDRHNNDWRLTFRAPLPAQEFNSHISMVTGEVAAQMMLSAGTGLLRTLPPISESTLWRLRRSAEALNIAWPSATNTAHVLATMDVTQPHEAAFVDFAANLLRGSCYTPLDGQQPAEATHAGRGAPYAHVTAPFRRLADRYTTEVCLALSAGKEVPSWARAAVQYLPGVMSAADRRSSTVENAVFTYTEATILAERVSEIFAATVVEPAGDAEPDPPVAKAIILLHKPTIWARCVGTGLEPGAVIEARLVEADPVTRRVRFAAA